MLKDGELYTQKGMYVPLYCRLASRSSGL